jgi:photosystem II stability/assembly factor-like uncharacterized protein
VKYFHQFHDGSQEGKGSRIGIFRREAEAQRFGNPIQFVNNLKSAIPIIGVNLASIKHGQHRPSRKKTVLAMNQELFRRIDRCLFRGVVVLLLWQLNIEANASEIEIGIRSHSLGTNDYSDIVHHDRKWTIVGNEGTILNSSDGINWIQIESGTRLGIRSLAHSLDLWIAVGDQGLILASRDREAWAHLPSPTTRHLNEVSYASGEWIAVGDGGTIIASADGVTWVQRPQSSTKFDLHSLDFGRGLWVAVGDAAVSLFSTDGVQWTQQWLDGRITEKLGNRLSLTKVAFNGRRWITVGGGYRPGFAIMFQSRYGIEWTQVPNLLEIPPIHDMLVDDERGSVLVGQLGVGTKINGQDRLTRTEIIDKEKTTLNAIAEGPEYSIAVGDRGLITAIARDITPIGTIKKVGDGSIKSIAHGQDIFIAATGGSSLLSSKNGIDWQDQPLPLDIGVNAVRYNEGLWTAVGELGVVFTSTDSLSWTAHRSSTNEPLNDIAGQSGLWIAVGNSLTIIQTKNFQSWESTAFPRVRGSNQSHLVSIENHGETWIAVGDRGIMLKSTDGTNWESLNPSRFSTSWSKIKFLNSRWWALGVKNCCTPIMIQSEDEGETWQAIELPQHRLGRLLDIESDGELTLVVGEPRIQEAIPLFGPDRNPSYNLLSSKDDIQWQAAQSGIQGSFSTILNANNRWFAGSDRGVIVELIPNPPNGPQVVLPSSNQDIPAKPQLSIRPSRPGYVIVTYTALGQGQVEATRTLGNPFRKIQGKYLPGNIWPTVEVEYPTNSDARFFKLGDQ